MAKRNNDRRYMSVAEIDAWAAEQNEIAAHNLRVLYADLIQLAEKRKADWKAPGILEYHRFIRARYGVIRMQQRGGRRLSYNRAEIRQAVEVRHEVHSQQDWYLVTATVAWGVERKPGHDLKYVTKVVRRYARDMRW